MAREPLKLFRHHDHPDAWIGEDEHGALLLWPAESNGWAKRTPYTGARRGLEAVEPAEARGTRWPGAGTGAKPRAGGKPSKTVSIRASDEEREEWERAAGTENLSEWARRTLTETARRARR